MNALKWAYKAAEKNLDSAVKKHQRKPTIASNQEIEQLERALAEASILLTLREETANEAIAEQEAVNALLASLSRPTPQEATDVIDVDEDKLYNKEYNKEYDEEAELNEYTESIEGVI